MSEEVVELAEVIINRLNIHQRGDRAELAYYTDSVNGGLNAYIQVANLPDSTNRIILNNDCHDMLKNCNNLNQMIDMAYLDMYLNFDSVSNMSNFAKRAFVGGDFVLPETIRDISYAWEGCGRPTNLNVNAANDRNYYNLQNAAYAFSNSQSPNLQFLRNCNWIQNASFMYYNCVNLNFSLSGLQFPNAVDVSYVFYNDKNLRWSSGSFGNLAQNATAALAETMVSSFTIGSPDCNLKNVSFMLSNCVNLNRLTGNKVYQNTIESAVFMLSGSTKLSSSLDLSGFTSLVNAKGLAYGWGSSMNVRGVLWVNSNRLNSLESALEGCNNINTIVIEDSYQKNAFELLNRVYGTLTAYVQNMNFSVIVKDENTYNFFKSGSYMSYYYILGFMDDTYQATRYQSYQNVRVNVYGNNNGSNLNMIADNNINTQEHIYYHSVGISRNFSMNVYYAPNLGHYEDYFGIKTPWG